MTAYRKWLGILNELKNENVQLKDWLSESISGQVPVDFVERAETFQQQFVEKDQIIDLLRRDIAVLLEEVSIHGMRQVNKKQYLNLEKAIMRLQIEFQKMKLSFLNFLNHKRAS